MAKKKELLHEKVFYKLREKIINGNFKSGETLDEGKIASQMGVSITPVREALRMLESKGLVISVPHKGKVVRGFTIKDMVELYEIREALEALAFKKATENLSEKDINYLFRLVKEMERHVKEGDLNKLHDVNIEFDRYIYKISGNKRLYEMLEELLPLTMRIRITSLRIPNRAEEVKEEHKKIFEAMKEKNAEEVENLVKEHIRNSSIHVRRLLKEIEMFEG